MIELRDVSFTYAVTGVRALKNVSLKIFPGEFVLVVGDSGSGKSTLLRSMNGLVPHFHGGKLEGDILIKGKRTVEMRVSEISGVVGTVFQDPESQILMQSVENELAFPLENRGMAPEQIAMRMEEVAALTGIERLLDRKTENLSGGEKQKVAIATAIMQAPEYLVLDEPTSQLDPSSAEAILSVLQRLNEELGMTIIMVEHRLERIMHRADRMLVMQDGKLAGDGEPELVAMEHDLDAMGVGYPQIARAAKLLGHQYLPLTVKEGKKYMGTVKPHAQKAAVPENILLTAKNVKFQYDDVPVLRNLNLDVRAGEILGLVGNNGSGKSTLAKLLAGILAPQRGKVLIDGRDIHRMKDDKRASYAGMVFQNPRLHLFSESIYGDIAVSGAPEKIMKMLRIWDIRERSAEDLSGGERMLAAIATVAVNEPKLLILDEPTRGLSWKYRQQLAEFLKWYSRKRSVLIISHDMDFLARTCNRIAMLARGKIVKIEEKHEFMENAMLYTTQINRISREAILEEELIEN